MERRLVAEFTVLVVAAVAMPLTVAAHSAGNDTPAAASNAQSIATSGDSTSADNSGAVVAPPLGRDSNALPQPLQQLIDQSGASVGVRVVELGGTDPITWSVDGDAVFDAASTYKLAALMMEAQGIAAGTTDPNGLVCYEPGDYEAGWFDDYVPGECFTRNQLASRAGQQSDNTAGHMLVRDVGGAGALNAWAASLGATDSAFFVDNTTSAADLATLWVAEADGEVGGAAAQGWLYPLLTGTVYESGIPAGVPPGVTVVHKIGADDAVEDDAALVESGPSGPYVLAVMTNGGAAPVSWGLIAGISAAVWQEEAARPQ